MRIYLIGYMGSGKTTAGRQLARRMGLEFIDLDEYIEHTYKTTIPLFFSKYDEQAFRMIERESLHRTAFYGNVVVSTGGGTPCFFDNMDWMNANGLTVYLKMHPGSLFVRLSESKETRPLIRQKSREELIAFITENLAFRESYYNRAALTVPGENLDIEMLFAKIHTFKGTMQSLNLMTPFESAFSKLKIDPSIPVLVANAPADYIEALRKFNESVISPDSAEQLGKFRFVQLFVSRQSELETQFPSLLQKFDEEGQYWICYPKKSSGMLSDLSRDKGWSILKEHNYRPVAMISVDESWSAVRVKSVSQVKSRERVSAPEINYEKREVDLPEDFRNALLQAGLLERFQRLSFTHRKEHVLAIVESKKPETRARRIRKAIELLTK